MYTNAFEIPSSLFDRHFVVYFAVEINSILWFWSVGSWHSEIDWHEATPPHSPQSTPHSPQSTQWKLAKNMLTTIWINQGGEFKPWKIEERSDMRLTFEEYLEKNMSFVFSFKDAETTILCKSFNVSKLLRWDFFEMYFTNNGSSQ